MMSSDHDSVDVPVYLMCPPEHYAIDAHATAGPANDMSVEGARVYANDPAAFRERAVRKWERFRAVLERELGARIIELPASEGLSDQVFAADGSISLTRPDGSSVALLSRFTYEERQAEVVSHAEALRAYDPSCELHEATFNIEGCGDNVYDPCRDVFWSGCTREPKRSEAGCGRSDARAHAQLEELTGAEAVGLEVRRPFFHLDTAVAILPGGHVMCCPDGLSDDAFMALRTRAFAPFGLTEDEHLIRVSRADAERYACNVVTRGDRVVLPNVSDALLDRLRASGYDPITVDLEEFILSGGGPHCLTNRVNERRVVASASGGTGLRRAARG